MNFDSTDTFATSQYFTARDAAEWEQNQAEQRMQEKSQSAARKTPSLRNEPLTNILDEQSIADWMRDEAIEKEALRELFAAIQGLDLESNYVVDGKCHADRARIAVKRPR